MAFTYPQKILFRHCDPNGIVFYPRYFEMANDVVEAWFADHLKTPFETLHGERALGVPTVALSVEFSAPSRHGEELIFTLTPRRIGRSSVALTNVGACGDERRLAISSTLVLAEAGGGGAQPWPDDLRARIEAEIEPEEDV